MTRDQEVVLRTAYWGLAVILLIILVCMAVGVAFAWDQPTRGPKLALMAVRPWDLEVKSNPPGWDGHEMEEALRYQMIASALRPEEVAVLRYHNPSLISLYPMTFWGVDDEDYEGGWRMDPRWQIPDSLWSLDRLIQCAYIENLKLGVDWAYRTTDGRPITRWGKRHLNWTAACPKGVWGPSRGRTFAEFSLQAALRIAGRREFREAWDGFLLDSYPPACCFDRQVSEDIDWNLDGINDGCYRAACDNAREWSRWVQEEDATSEWFVSRLSSSLRPDQLLLLGQDWLRTPAGNRINGWKLENWLLQDGSDVGNWWSHWYGIRNCSGYLEAEQRLHRLPDLPLFDSFQGWDMSIVDCVLRREWPEDRVRRHALLALATALLGDGWVSWTWWPLDARYLPPEVEEWQVELPALSDVYEFNGKMCRAYRRVSTGRVCTVVVDPRNGDARMLDYWYGPAARFYGEKGRTQ